MRQYVCEKRRTAPSKVLTWLENLAILVHGLYLSDHPPHRNRRSKYRHLPPHQRSEPHLTTTPDAGLWLAKHTWNSSKDPPMGSHEAIALRASAHGFRKACGAYWQAVSATTPWCISRAFPKLLMERKREVCKLSLSRRGYRGKRR